jgi:ABC-2 type transport system ATP-binding protein
LVNSNFVNNNAPILNAQNLIRDFGTNKSPGGIRRAVNGVSVNIKAGEISALLGPNGAGKTTTVRMCGTLLTPTAGTVTVAGIDALKHPREARRATGLVLGGEQGFYSRASARKNLLFFADVAGVPSKNRRRNVTQALEAVQLTDRADDPVRDFSRGMKQRLHIARALLNQPTLLLLDEPTSGLDPQIAAEIRSLIRQLANSGVGVLLTSHYLGEVEQLADYIQIIAEGQEIAAGTVAEIAKASGFSESATRPATLEESYLALVNSGDN